MRIFNCWSSAFLGLSCIHQPAYPFYSGFWHVTTTGRKRPPFIETDAHHDNTLARRVFHDISSLIISQRWLSVLFLQIKVLFMIRGACTYWRSSAHFCLSYHFVAMLLSWGNIKAMPTLIVRYFPALTRIFYKPFHADEVMSSSRPPKFIFSLSRRARNFALRYWRKQTWKCRDTETPLSYRWKSIIKAMRA